LFTGFIGFVIMPSLINTDNAGNVFFNYVTPVEQGQPGRPNSSILNGLATYFQGPGRCNIRFNAPGLETKSGAITSDIFNNPAARVTPFFGGTNMGIDAIMTATGNTNQHFRILSAVNLVSTDFCFCVANQYSLVAAAFTTQARTTLRSFIYVGWTRENVFGNLLGVIGINYMTPSTLDAQRPQSINGSIGIVLSTAADAITSPPIVCTPGTDPGDGSETWTDIVIRDAAAPNNPVGKLWNCVDAPANYTVGGLYKNVGAYDADGSTSEQDIYLCVMPWGERKLLMRVWTENVFS